MELNGLLGKPLGNGFRIEQAWCEINVAEMKAILVQVRSRLLDFLLELKELIGDAATETEVKQKIAKANPTSMFNNAIFGANTTIVVGHHVNQNVHNETIKGDLGKLTAALKEIGVPGDEIQALEAAVEEDRANGEEPSFSGKTGHWYTGLLARAAKGGVKIGVDVATSEVGKLLGSFFGVS